MIKDTGVFFEVLKMFNSVNIIKTTDLDTSFFFFFDLVYLFGGGGGGKGEEVRKKKV